MWHTVIFGCADAALEASGIPLAASEYPYRLVMDPLLFITDDPGLAHRLSAQRSWLNAFGVAFDVTAVVAMTKVATARQCWSVRGRAKP